MEREEREEIKTLVATILEGLEQADPHGVGFGEEHLKAYRLANAAQDLLEAAQAGMLQLWAHRHHFSGADHVAMNLLSAAIAKATKGE